MTRESTLTLHAEIKKEFEKLSNITEYGVTKYTIEYRLRKVGEKFFKSSKTIENIVFNRVKYS